MFKIITILTQSDCKEIEYCLENDIFINNIVVYGVSTPIVLPENLVAHHINLMNSTNVVLPNKLTCFILNISNSNISEISSTHLIKHELTANNLPGDLKLPDNFSTLVLNIRDSQYISKLPKNLVVYELEMSGTNIKHVPDGTCVRTIRLSSDSVLNTSDVGGYIFNSTDSTEQGYSILKFKKY